MESNFFAYLQQLELMVFFSGYPLLYGLVLFFWGNKKSKFMRKMVSLLPYAYALLGTFYLGLQIKNLYLNYSPGNVKLIINQPYLVIWGLLSLLFWIPALSKKRVWSLVHSLVFFFFLVRDIVLRFTGPQDQDILSNDMRVYTTSILLNIAAYVIIILLSFFITHNKKVK